MRENPDCDERDERVATDHACRMGGACDAGWPLHSALWLGQGVRALRKGMQTPYTEVDWSEPYWPPQLLTAAGAT